MPFEIPQPGKFVIASFEEQHLSYPVVVTSQDPTIAGYVLPAIGSACPDPRYTATHFFAGWTPTHLDNRVLWKYQLPAGPPLIGAVMSPDADGDVCVTAKQQLPTADTVLTPSMQTLAYSDTPIDIVRKERNIIEHAGAFPVLAGTRTDDQTGIKTNFTKQIVAAGTPSAGAYDDVQPLDKWRSIQIVTILDVASLPSPITRYAQIRHSFPDIMTAYEVIALVDAGGPTIDLAQKYLLTAGYSGPCNAKLVERFLTAAAYAAYTAPAITIFQPQSTQVMFSAVDGGRARVWDFKTPMSLHAAFSTAVTGSGGVTGDPATVPSTSPVGYTPGDYIYVDVQPEKYRFGAWRILEIQAQIPVP